MQALSEEFKDVYRQRESESKRRVFLFPPWTECTFIAFSATRSPGILCTSVVMVTMMFSTTFKMGPLHDILEPDQMGSELTHAWWCSSGAGTVKTLSRLWTGDMVHQSWVVLPQLSRFWFELLSFMLANDSAHLSFHLLNKHIQIIEDLCFVYECYLGSIVSLVLC